MINPQTASKAVGTGAFSRSAWFDLPVRDLADAMSFYEGLFGWRYRQMDDSPEAHYVMIEVDGELIGGLRRVHAVARAAGDEPQTPVLYFNVERLDEKLRRAQELGGQAVGPTVELGRERGRYQWLRDREGNVIGLWAAA